MKGRGSGRGGAFFAVALSSATDFRTRTPGYRRPCSKPHCEIKKKFLPFTGALSDPTRVTSASWPWHHLVGRANPMPEGKEPACVPLPRPGGRCH